MSALPGPHSPGAAVSYRPARPRQGRGAAKAGGRGLGLLRQAGRRRPQEAPRGCSRRGGSLGRGDGQPERRGPRWNMEEEELLEGSWQPRRCRAIRGMGCRRPGAALGMEHHQDGPWLIEGSAGAWKAAGGPSAGDLAAFQSRGISGNSGRQNMVPRAPLSCPHLGKRCCMLPRLTLLAQGQKTGNDGCPAPLSCSADRRDTEYGHLGLFPSLASGRFYPPSPSPSLSRCGPPAVTAGQRNFSWRCLVLMVVGLLHRHRLREAGEDRWGVGSPWGILQPGQAPTPLLASLSLPAGAQAEAHIQPTHPGTRGGRGT